MNLKPNCYHKGLSEKNISILSEIKKSISSKDVIGYNLSAPSVIRKEYSMDFVKKFFERKKISIHLKEGNPYSNVFQIFQCFQKDSSASR